MYINYSPSRTGKSYSITANHGSQKHLIARLRWKDGELKLTTLRALTLLEISGIQFFMERKFKDQRAVESSRKLPQRSLAEVRSLAAAR